MPVKSKVEISQNFVAFSEYMNFNNKEKITTHLIGQETLSTIGDTVTRQIGANAHSVSRSWQEIIGKAVELFALLAAFAIPQVFVGSHHNIYMGFIVPFG